MLDVNNVKNFPNKFAKNSILRPMVQFFGIGCEIQNRTYVGVGTCIIYAISTLPHVRAPAQAYAQVHVHVWAQSPRQTLDVNNVKHFLNKFAKNSILRRMLQFVGIGCGIQNRTYAGVDACIIYAISALPQVRAPA